jgi:hypothetical protein
MKLYVIQTKLSRRRNPSTRFRPRRKGTLSAERADTGCIISDRPDRHLSIGIADATTRGIRIPHAAAASTERLQFFCDERELASRTADLKFSAGHRSTGNKRDGNACRFELRERLPEGCYRFPVRADRHQLGQRVSCLSRFAGFNQGGHVAYAKRQRRRIGFKTFGRREQQPCPARPSVDG